jgi:hypothetical protein
VKHDPLLYEDAQEMVEYVAQALKQTSREATILLYAPALDPHLQKMTELADRVFCFYEEQAPARGRATAEARMPGAQVPEGHGIPRIGGPEPAWRPPSPSAGRPSSDRSDIPE